MAPGCSPEWLPSLAPTTATRVPYPRQGFTMLLSTRSDVIALNFHVFHHSASLRVLASLQDSLSFNKLPVHILSPLLYWWFAGFHWRVQVSDSSVLGFASMVCSIACPSTFPTVSFIEQKSSTLMWSLFCRIVSVSGVLPCQFVVSDKDSFSVFLHTVSQFYQHQTLVFSSYL